MTKNLFFILFLSLISCKKIERNSDYQSIDFKEEMRSFVISISQYAKNINPDFLIIPQNGVELVTRNGEEIQDVHSDYLQAIDGQGQEELNFGYEEENQPTPTDVQQHLKFFLDKEKINGKTILITDYCFSPDKIEQSYEQNTLNGYIGYAAVSRELDLISQNVYEENDLDIETLSQVKNFLYLINPQNFSRKTDFINALSQTNYDLIIMDLFFNRIPFTAQEINLLKHKHNGGLRKVIAYVSIGEAESYRYYWKPEWNMNKPFWLEAENPDWPGNYEVKYWEKEWQKIIYGNNQSYIKKVIDANFDGVYLDIIDAYEFFESRYSNN